MFHCKGCKKSHKTAPQNPTSRGKAQFPSYTVRKFILQGSLDFSLRNFILSLPVRPCPSPLPSCCLHTLNTYRLLCLPSPYCLSQVLHIRSLNLSSSVTLPPQRLYCCCSFLNSLNLAAIFLAVRHPEQNTAILMILVCIYFKHNAELCSQSLQVSLSTAALY